TLDGSITASLRFGRRGALARLARARLATARDPTSSTRRAAGMRSPIRTLVALLAALVAGLVPGVVRAQGQVVLYCTPQEEWCRAMVTAFERATGIKVNMTRKSSGENYAQVKAEAANPKGDIWWGGTGDPHLQAAEEG